MHAEAYTYVATLLLHLSPRLRIVEFGGRNFNGSVRPLFSQAESYVGIDLYDGPNVDWVGSALDYTPTTLIDTVVCCEVLEHTPEWPDLLRHAHDLLSDDGVLILTCAMPPRAPHSGMDGNQVRQGEYYANVDPADFEARMATMHWAEHELSTADRGDLYCWARK